MNPLYWKTLTTLSGAAEKSLMSTEQQSGGSVEPPQFFSFQKILQGVKYNHCKNGLNR
jgi:hypothetical protein